MLRKTLYCILFFQLICACSPHMPAFESAANKKEQSRLSEHYFAEGMKFYILNDYTRAEQWFRKALENNPNQAAINYMISKTALSRKDYNQAVYFAEKAVKSNDEIEHYYIQLADVYREQANLTEATKVYKKMIDVFPQKQENYLTLASMLLYLRKPEEALEVYSQIEKKFGKTPELSRQKLDLYIRLNDQSLALQEAKNLAESYPEEISLQLSYVELLINYGKKDEALNLLKTIRSKEPENPYALLIMARLHKEKGEQQHYLDLLQEVFKSSEMGLDSKISLLEDLKKNSSNKEDSKKQISQLSQSLTEAHPDDARSFIIAGDLLLQNNDQLGALKQYRKAIEMEKSDFNLWYKLLALESETSQLDSMIVHAEQALEIYPNQAVLWYMHGTAFLQSKKYDDAIASLEHGKRLSGGNNRLLIQFHALLADSYNEVKQYSKSDEAYEQALKLDSNNTHVLNNYSYFLSLRNENLSKALSMTERLITIAPDNVAYLDTYAWVLYKLNRFEESRIFLEKALKNTEDGTIIEHYGDVLYKLGLIDQAVEQWKKASKSGGTSELIEKKITDKKLYE
jgi:tetratricopeptide (TPR) repeat protein